jgi:hypothetical protein
MSGRGELVDDRVMLGVVWLVEGQGWTLAKTAAHLRLTRSMVAGIVRRVRIEADKAEAAPLKPGEKPASRTENLDGGMPERWWQDGLKARKDAA